MDRKLVWVDTSSKRPLTILSCTVNSGPSVLHGFILNTQREEWEASEGKEP